MTRIVVDASVTLSWCFPDEQTSLSMEVLKRLRTGEQVLVPSFWSLEVLNSLLVGERRGRISRQQTEAFLRDVAALRPTFDYASLAQVNGPVQRLCRDHGLTPYDALYLELAMRAQAPLATQDKSQKNVAMILNLQCL